ncbi:MAG: alpha/beta fold hydrolase [Leptospiraceae bacterium]|nr:alpha/beta fold hydrolase [Leptospiraceae bacterium]
MAEYLKYVSDELPNRPVWKQILFEFLYKLEYFSGYFLGIFFDLSSRTSGTKRPVVLVPGLIGRTWNFRRLRKRLIQNGHPVYLIQLGFQVGNIITKSQKLEKFLDQHKITDCYIIGHSMGGLIASSMGYRGRDRVRKLYTVGSPLKGTYISYLMPIFPATLQMIPQSRFIKNFRIVFNSISNVQSIFAKHDEVMLPQSSSHMGRFDDVLIPEWGHLNLIMGPLGIECLSELVRGEEAKDPLPETSSQPEQKIKNNKAGK